MAASGSNPVQERQDRAKGADRIQINNMLAAICLATLTILLSTNSESLSSWLIVQLACSVPLLATSSLAYSKLTVRDAKEYAKWDKLGWFCQSVGYGFVLNTMTLMLVFYSFRAEALAFMGLVIALYGAYSVLDVTLKPSRAIEKGLKFLFYVLVLIAGTARPLSS